MKNYLFNFQKDKIKRNNKASMLDAIMYFNKRKIKVNR